jgi:hypothetical protein
VAWYLALFVGYMLVAVGGVVFYKAMPKLFVVAVPKHPPPAWAPAAAQATPREDVVAAVAASQRPAARVVRVRAIAPAAVVARPVVLAHRSEEPMVQVHEYSSDIS